jgi:Rrf2 family protein
MMSQTADYALRAVVHLARSGGDPQTTQQIARATGVTPGYLSKVMQNLVKAGIVTSQRGLHGGFRLQKTPENLTILEVVNTVDPVQRIHECPLKLQTHTVLCALHRRMDDLLAIIEERLGSTTVADLFAEDEHMLCEVP